MHKPITSHELASRLLNTAKLLFTREPIELPGVEDAKIVVSYYDREPFLNAVQTMGSGKKDFGSYDFKYTPNDSILELTVPRNKVCNKIQEEKWECVPLLTPDEFTVGRE